MCKRTLFLRIFKYPDLIFRLLFKLSVVSNLLILHFCICVSLHDYFRKYYFGSGHNLGLGIVVSPLKEVYSHKPIRTK